MDGEKIVEVVDGGAIGATPDHVSGETTVRNGGIMTIPPCLEIGHEVRDDRGRGGAVASRREHGARCRVIDPVCSQLEGPLSLRHSVVVTQAGMTTVLILVHSSME